MKMQVGLKNVETVQVSFLKVWCGYSIDIYATETLFCFECELLMHSHVGSLITTEEEEMAGS